MTKKIKILIGVNLVLIIALFFSFQSFNSNSSTIDESISSFALRDTSGVDRIMLGNIELVKESEDEWLINGEFVAQPARIKSLLAVLSRIEVKRPVAESSKEDINNRLENNGIEVKAFSGDELIVNYQLSGKDDESYAKIDENDPFIIYIPGYFVNISELFTIKPSEWRDNRILNTSFNSVQSLELEYPHSPENSFEIKYDGSFSTIEGIDRLDSAKVYAYLQQYQDFTAKFFVENAKTLKDSLLNAQPFCKISLKDLYQGRNNNLRIYINPEVIYGISENPAEVVVLDRQKLRNFLVGKPEFVKPK
ncbi:DUF4340 domain-containing protein [Flexithrix dorotheae]|uniref:DUF4340 domain-containing protein n=1 Tax=Flexithrix dorotheae TaxID=70993 RepID=UPI000372A649|nr:DUF4340 domain-containing protein [Flexithrix dorotheae]